MSENGPVEVAMQNELVPSWLRKRLWSDIVTKHMVDMFHKTYENENVISFAQSRLRHVLESCEEMASLDDFAEWFDRLQGESVRTYADVTKIRQRVGAAASETLRKAGMMHTQFADNVRSYAVSVCSPLDASCISWAEPVVVAVVDRIIANQKRTCFQDMICTVRARLPAGTNMEDMLDVAKPLSGRRWECGRCQEMYTRLASSANTHGRARNVFAGPANQLWNHSKVMHDCVNLDDVSAFCLENECTLDEVDLLVAEERSMFDRRHDAAHTIQRAWRRAIACPDFAICKRRLLREIDEMM
jgi:hypothetical protein